MFPNLKYPQNNTHHPRGHDGSLFKLKNPTLHNTSKRASTLKTF